MRVILRGGLRLTISGAALWALGEVVSTWQAYADRIKAVWEDMRQAAPTWFGGAGKGWGAISGGRGVGLVGGDFASSWQWAREWWRPPLEQLRRDAITEPGIQRGQPFWERLPPGPQSSAPTGNTNTVTVAPVLSS